jgi:hypothetical protein
MFTTRLALESKGANMSMQISVEKIAPVTFGGGGYGNTFKYEVTVGDVAVLASCERDVASNFRLAGLAVPEEFSGPYDGYGNKVEG